VVFFEKTMEKGEHNGDSESLGYFPVLLRSRRPLTRKKYDHTKSNKTTPNLGGGGVLLGICDHPKSPKENILKASFTGNVTQIEQNYHLEPPNFTILSSTIPRPHNKIQFHTCGGLKT